ncbi:hypothetical protein TWF788_005458 [Orbilia oligospora]|uniref:Mid2 domain-containing protein n=1 Tax=Orbilia oligospora TaxID=2813651 RepID=A0A7C8P115_ORBOL|nr:hypothetical protein TWF788_005458 [Orbilia oligospora]
MFVSSFSLLVAGTVLCYISAALEVEINGLGRAQQSWDPRPFEQNVDDCSNSTHRWHSLQGNCFNEKGGIIPYTPLHYKRSSFGNYLDFVGLHPRDICGPGETTCWAVSCCRIGEICGSFGEGCKVSWSTIYSTTITTSWSTVTSWVLPRTEDVDYSTITVNTTIYMTVFNPITLPGEGENAVLDTNIIVSTTLVLSAYTPPAVTRTEMVTRTQQPEAEITLPPPQLRARETGAILPRAKEIPRRWEGISYTTLTVFVTTFFTTSTTTTLENTVVEVTEINTISSIATQNQTHFETPTGFTTMTITQMDTSTSYAYGTVETPTQVLSITTFVPAFAEEVGRDGLTGTAVPSSGGARQFSVGEIAGLVIGLTSAAILIVVGIVLLRRRGETESSRVSASTRRRNIFDRNSSSPNPGVPATILPKTAMRRFSHSEFTDPNTDRVSGSPISELFFSGLNMTDENRYSRNHGVGGSRLSRGSRGSVMSSVSTVPEEYILPEVLAKSAPIRNSMDERNWGRGYGGRGGYNNVGNRDRNTTLSDFGAMI